MTHVFISHVERDAGIATETANGLEAAGYSTWYFERDTLRTNQPERRQAAIQNF